MSLQGVGEDQLAVSVVVFALVLRNRLIPRFADVGCPVPRQIDQSHDRDAAERVFDSLQDLVAVGAEEDRLGRSPQSVSNVVSSPGLTNVTRIRRINCVPVLVVIDAVRWIHVLSHQAFEIPPGRVVPPPDHILGENVAGDALIEAQPQFVGPRGHGLTRRRFRMVEANVDTAQDQEQRSDRLAHPIVHRRAAAIDIAPPGLQIIRPVASDLLVVYFRQMDLDGLGDELGDRCPASSVLVVIVLSRRAGSAPSIPG